jgi:hypothetical protein
MMKFTKRRRRQHKAMKVLEHEGIEMPGVTMPEVEHRAEIVPVVQKRVHHEHGKGSNTTMEIIHRCVIWTGKQHSAY